MSQQAEPSAPEEPMVAGAAPRARDWLLTLPFLLTFALLLLVFDPLQRLARVFGPRPHEIVEVTQDIQTSSSYKYMGDPFKYPEIAERNRIINPDLIYPGQRVLLTPVKTAR